MTQSERRYWFDTTYDRLDRMKLVELVRAHGYDLDDDELDLESRADLIDVLVDTRVEAEDDAEEAGIDYPLRRPFAFAAPSWLTGEPQPRVHLRWEADWREALEQLLDDDASWDLPSTVKDGDVVLTVLGCVPPVVAALDRIAHTDGQWQIGDRAIIAQPITWGSLWCDAKEADDLRGFTGRLTARAAKRLVNALQAEADKPKPVFLDAGDCTPVGHYPSAVEVLARLQAVEHATEAGQRSLAVECGACGSTNSLEVHFDRPLHECVRLEVQDHLDDVAHLCSQCHRLAHPHSIAFQRRVLREAATPRCPACGGRVARPVVWGMALPEYMENYPDTIFAGCVVDDPIPAQWQCENCDAQYATVTMTQLRHLQVGPPSP